MDIGTAKAFGEKNARINELLNRVERLEIALAASEREVVQISNGVEPALKLLEFMKACIQRGEAPLSDTWWFSDGETVLEAIQADLSRARAALTTPAPAERGAQHGSETKRGKRALRESTY